MGLSLKLKTGPVQNPCIVPSLGAEVVARPHDVIDLEIKDLSRENTQDIPRSYSSSDSKTKRMTERFFATPLLGCSPAGTVGASSSHLPVLMALIFRIGFWGPLYYN